MIDQLIAALNQEVDLSADEIADTLWLAMHMEKSGVDSTSQKSQKSKRNLETIEDNSNKRSQQDSSNRSETKISASQPKSTENKAKLYHQKPDKSQKSLEIPFKVPDAPSLREQLDLARALRPLMRRISSGSTLVLDEAATTQRIADEGIWLPVLKPTLEPWLDLELVVDEGISMQIWRHTIKELERLLKNYGIFRDVRVWGLISKEQNKIQIRKGIGAIAKNQSPRSAAELIDSSGRRLVLVVSDCVSDLWRSGAVNSALKTWANNVPTAIIQMLPKWLWCRTALGRATEVRFQGLIPSVSNRQLITNTVSLWSEIDEATGIKVPVFTLEPERVSNWAQMLVGRGNIKSSGFVFKPEIRNLERDKPSFNFSQSEFTAEQRVQAFRVTASPMARKLAGLLASAPVISLPVVRLIRETMLQDSQQVHVAEVFLGGLLKPLSEIEVDTEPDCVQYSFIDGVRELLIDSVPTSSVLNVVEEVSKFVAKKLGLSLEQFAAVLRNPEEISDSKVVEQVQPFAMVTAEILRCLGGKYEKFADSTTKLHQKTYNHIKIQDKINEQIIKADNLSEEGLQENWQIYHLNEIEKQIHQLALEIQQFSLYNTKNDLKKRRKLRNLLGLITQSGKLEIFRQRLLYKYKYQLRYNLFEDCYNDALQKTWLYIFSNLEKYDIEKCSFLNWFDRILEYRFIDTKNEYLKFRKVLLNKERQKVSVLSLNQELNDQEFNEASIVITYQDLIKSPYRDNQDLNKIEQFRKVIIDDPWHLFSDRYITNCPQASYQEITIQRINNKTWKEIANHFNLRVSTVASFFSRSNFYFKPFIHEHLEGEFILSKNIKNLIIEDRNNEFKEVIFQECPWINFQFIMLKKIDNKSWENIGVQLNLISKLQLIIYFYLNTIKRFHKIFKDEFNDFT